jgi:histidyl-tRNA synthetase
MLKTFRGTHDHLPDVAARYDFIIRTAQHLADLYGYNLINTPIFEYADVFSRTLGDTSDIVTKEMFTFEDRHGDKLVLRPEGTAGLMRCLLSNGLMHQLPQKYFYQGPMFRYERPQKGRTRQFHQIGVEFMGESSPLSDGEAITLAWDILGALSLQKKVSLHINSLGDTESRQTYRDLLVEYFGDFKEDLSADSQERLLKNPLRILDSKDPRDLEIVARAPSLKDSLNDESKDFFAKVLERLDLLKIPYTVNPRLVRGLDYYCHTAFEFVTDTLGAQSAVLAGGRYDRLALMMGHKEPIPSIGWAAGIERLELMLDQPIEPVRPFSIIPIGEAAEQQALQLSHDFRLSGLKVVMAQSGTLKSRMKYANKVNAKAVIILGDDELEKGVGVLKDLDTGTQQEISLSQLKDTLKGFS